MRPELRSLIEDYQRNVDTACRLLQQRLSLPVLEWFSWRQTGIAMSGWLDDAKTISYQFHGIGSRVAIGSKIIDFDLGPAGRRDGFDAWRLCQFANSTSQRSPFRGEAALRAELLQLLETGELVRDGDSLGAHLFYLADEPNRMNDNP